MNFNQLVPTSSSSNNKNSSRRKAIAWSPSCPSSLSLLTPITEKIQMAFSDGGLGCTQEEVSALLELMDARDVFESLLSENVIINPEEISKLASRYISILGNCIDEWNDRLDSSSTSDPEKEEVERQNLDALTNMNSIIHLSSICLLSPTFSIAAFVKYLRHHFVSNPLLTLFEGGDDSALEQMLNSPQPEYFRGGDLYWNLIKSFLERGLLEDAWNVISHHSLYKQSTQHAQDQAQHHITQEEQEEIALNRQGFECLYALLYSAPIPGGHSDDAVDDDNDKQEEEGEGELVEDVELLPGVPRNAHKFWNNSQTLPAAYSYFVKWNTHLQNFIRGGLPGHLQTRIPQLIPCVLMVLAGSSSSSSSINSAMKSKEQLQYKWAHTILYEIMYIRPDLNFYRVCERTNAAMSHEKSPWELMILSIMRGDAGEAVKATYSLGGGSSAALPSAVSALFCDLLTHANLLSFPKQSSPESKISNHHLELLLRAASSCISSFSTITPKSSKALMRYKNIGLQCAIRLLRYTHHFEGVSMMADFVSNSSLCYDAPDDYDVETILKLISSYPRRKQTENTLIYDAYTDICISRAQYYLQDARPGGAAYWYLKCIREFNLARNSESSNSHSSSQAQQDVPSRATSLLSQLCHKTAMNILTLLSFLVDCYMEQSNKLAEQVTKSHLSYQDILTSNSNLKSLLECAEEIIVSVKEEVSDVFEDNGTFSQNIELFFNARKQSNQTTTVYSILFLHNMVQLAASLMKENTLGQNDQSVEEAASLIAACLSSGNMTKDNLMNNNSNKEGTTIAPIASWWKFLKLAHLILHLDNSNNKKNTKGLDTDDDDDEMDEENSDGNTSNLNVFSQQSNRTINNSNNNFEKDIFKCAFKVNGVHVLLSCISTLTASGFHKEKDEKINEKNEVFLKQMRSLLADALMNAFVLENRKKKKTTKNVKNSTFRTNYQEQNANSNKAMMDTVKFMLCAPPCTS